MTKKLYLENTYLFENTAKIVSKGTDERGSYIVVDQTVFYPQGGGQPSDTGTIQGENAHYLIHHVKEVNGEIRHYSNENNLDEHETVVCVIDKNKRLHNARYHTAAHLIGNIIEDTYTSFKPIKAHAFPDQSYIEFTSNNDSIESAEKIKLSLLERLKEEISAKKSVHIFAMGRKEFEESFYPVPHVSTEKIFRLVQIENFLPIPCGGTHISSLDHIGNISIESIKIKNNILKISYRVI